MSVPVHTILNRANTAAAAKDDNADKHKVADYMASDNIAMRARPDLGPDYVRTNDPAHGTEVGSLYRDATPQQIKNAVLTGNVRIKGKLDLGPDAVRSLYDQIIEHGKIPRSRSGSAIPPPSPPGPVVSGSIPAGSRSRCPRCRWG